MKNKINIKSLILGVFIGLFMLSTLGVYASVTGAGKLGSLFEKIGAVYKLMGDEIKDNTVDSSEIEDDTLTADDLAPNSVGNSELASNSVYSINIKDGEVKNDDLACGSVTSCKIADYAIEGVDILTGTITSAQLGIDSVGNSELASNAVYSSNIKNYQVKNIDLATNSVTSIKIDNYTIQEHDLNSALRTKINSSSKAQCPPIAVRIHDNTSGKDEYLGYTYCEPISKTEVKMYFPYLADGSHGWNNDWFNLFYPNATNLNVFCRQFGFSRYSDRQYGPLIKDLKFINKTSYSTATANDCGDTDVRGFSCLEDNDINNSKTREFKEKEFKRANAIYNNSGGDVESLYYVVCEK